MSFNDELVQRIARNDSTLTRVDLSDENIDDAGARKIAEALLTNTVVTEINLRENIISVEGARALAEMLRHNATLAALNLRGNEIGVDGVRALAESLPLNVTLIELELSCNGIGDEGARALAGALPRNATLAMLDLTGNNIGDEGARALAGALPRNTTLTTLNLGWNYIFDEGARALADTLQFQNHSLESLGNTLMPAVSSRTASYLEINRERRSPVGAYIRKTQLFPKLHIGNLTTQSIVLPRAAEHLGHISGGLSIMFCFVKETHAALLANKNGTGTRKRKVNWIHDSEQSVE